MRYFKLATHLTVPRSLLPGPGNTHVRPAPGAVIAIDDMACARESRFVNGRVRAEDMKEISEAEYRRALADAAPVVVPVPLESSPAVAAKGK